MRLYRVGDNENIFHRHKRQNTIHGLLQKGSGAEQCDELFRCFLTADGPEAFAATSGHNNYVTVVDVGFGFHIIQQPQKDSISRQARCWHPIRLAFSGMR